MKQKKAGKRFLSILLTTGMLFGALPAAVFAAGEQSLPFTDVKEADWFYDSVQYVYENQMMSGTGDDVFTPDAATTRGMIVTILYRMEGNPATDSDAKFTDVSAGQYYAEAAAWANEKNIVNGYGSGAFGPNDPITREQMAAVFVPVCKAQRLSYRCCRKSRGIFRCRRCQCLRRGSCEMGCGKRTDFRRGK